MFVRFYRKNKTNFHTAGIFSTIYMSYDEKFKRVKERILENVVRIIRVWYEGDYFGFQIGDPHPIWEMYIDEFKKEFGQLVTDHVETMLFSAGKMLGFAVESHQKTTPNFNLAKLVEFVHTFVTYQFDDFDNWCDEIGCAMAGQDEVIEKVTDDPK